MAEEGISEKELLNSASAWPSVALTGPPATSSPAAIPLHARARKAPPAQAQAHLPVPWMKTNSPQARDTGGPVSLPPASSRVEAVPPVSHITSEATPRQATGSGLFL